ncbi:MAG: histidine kinase dimerization/phospho-acceptor domain-containing protein, partial [Methyloligellaceae bacterium]
ATAPITAKRERRTLVQILGKDQPVTTFGARAGVMELTLRDGRDALVTVRALANSQATITLLQPTARALRKWHQQATVGTTLLLTTGMLLLLIGVSFRWLSERSDQAEAALAAKERDLDILFDTSGIGLWDWNVARGHIRVSQAMNALMGWSEVEQSVPFGNIAAILHPKDNLYAAVKAAVRDGSEELDETFRIRDENGHWIPLRLRGSFRRDKTGNEMHLIGVVSEEQTRHGPGAPAQDLQLHDAVEAISEAFVLWDADNRLVMCNEKYKQFYNLSDEVVAPGTAYEKVIAEATAPVVRTRTTVSDDKTAGAHTYEAQLEDGNWLHIDERRTNDGGYVSVGTDITSLKQSQQRQLKSEDELKATITDLRHSRRELEQQKQQLVDLMEKYVLEKNRAEAANRAKSEFLANISHELRTPLNAVIGFSEIMKNALFGPVGNQKYLEYARDIHESGKYLLEVINDVLDMSKIEAGRINLVIKPLDAGEIIDDSIRVVAPAAAERSILVKRAGLKQLKMHVDKRALKQILLNLLSNAVKFTPKDGKVIVRLTKA